MIMTPKHMTSFKTINVILSISDKADFSPENALVTRIITILPYTYLTCSLATLLTTIVQRRTERTLFQ